ncbi:MAG: HdeD family acid-resistance protein [Acidimicrobiia bacterium]
MTDASALTADERTAVKAITGMWWLWLVTGVIWLLVSLVVLRFSNASVTTVGVILGLVFLGAAINEALTAAFDESWRWLHIVMAVIFAAGSLYCFIRPTNAFWALASVIGLLFVLKGTFDVILSAATKHMNDLWWLGLIAGILEIIIGFWVSQRSYPVGAALILLWVGFWAMFRGIAEIVMAFQVKKAGELV